MAEAEWPLAAQEVLGDRDGALARAEYVAYRAAIGAFAHLPVAGRKALSAVLGRTAMALDRRHTDSARRFVEQAFAGRLSGRERDRLVLGAWRHLIELTLEDARFNEVVLGANLMQHFDVEMSDDARRAAEARTGGLFVVPHVGMWEAMPAIGARIGFSPAYAVSRPPRNRPLSRFAQATREARGFRLIHRHGAIDGLLEVVKGGGWVGLMLDQRARGKTIVAPFFGRPAHCERSIPILVRRLGRPVVFGATYRTQRPFHYRTVVDKVLWPEELSKLSPEEIATAINREMERQILVAPEQYFWLHDRFRKAPEPARD